jgi:hypothetical protein
MIAGHPGLKRGLKRAGLTGEAACFDGSAPSHVLDEDLAKPVLFIGVTVDVLPPAQPGGILNSDGGSPRKGLTATSLTGRRPFLMHIGCGVPIPVMKRLAYRAGPCPITQGESMARDQPGARELGRLTTAAVVTRVLIPPVRPAAGPH